MMKATGEAGGVVGRRDFIAGVAGAAAFNIMRPAVALGTGQNSKIELGMIGCGGRGTWIAPLFLENGPYQFVACADYFPAKVEKFGEKFAIPADRRYSTMSGARRMLEGKMDAVVIESPPFLHPEHTADAVAAGKHAFVAKPIAVDVPGCTAFEEAGKRATEKGLVVLVDFQARANPLFREAAKRVLNGEIGTLVCGEAFNHAGGPGPIDADDSDPEFRLQHWGRYRALSGDFITEQAVHALDMAAWFVDADPLEAEGRGGRKARVGKGDNYDHFSVRYAFPGDVLLTFSGTQVTRAVPGGYEIAARWFGSRGLVDTLYNGPVTIRGEIPFRGGETGNLYTEGAVANIKDFAELVRARDASNPTVVPSVKSTLVTVLGRMAAYRRSAVTWKQLMDEKERLDPKLGGLKG